MAKLTTEEFIAAIKELSVLELNELVKACEEEFGVSAAAGVAVVAAGPAEAVEEKDEFDVELTSFGDSKVKVIKVVREVTGLGLKLRKSLTMLRKSSRKLSPRLRLRKSRASLRMSALQSHSSNYLSDLTVLRGRSHQVMMRQPSFVMLNDLCVTAPVHAAYLRVGCRKYFEHII